VSQDGQAAVELVALLPLVVVVGALLCQLALAGHAAWAAGAAARAAARAHAVGHDPRAAARDALPIELRRGVRVSETTDGAIRVHVAIPAVTPGLALGRASAEAHFPVQDA
jgi:hypothetical protein